MLSVQYDNCVQDYLRLADQLAADIAAGAFRPGDRLAPQRRFAGQHAIAASTAARVYAELIRRGLAVGEVGRGTFVRAGRPAVAGGPGDVGAAGAPLVNLAFNFPILADQGATLAESLGELMSPEVIGAAIQPAGAGGTAAIRDLTAAFLARGGWQPRPADVHFTGNGRQAIAAAIAALMPRGGRLGVEALTYPMVQTLAARLGVRLVPLAMDESGLVPGALASAHRRDGLDAVYLQPTLHNPLGTTMPPGRRTEIAGLLDRLDLYAIEDAVYSFLREDPAPLAAHAARRTIFVDSLSKRVAPGLTAGFALAPAGLAGAIAGGIRSGGWAASGFALAAAAHWFADGTADALTAAKRADAAARQRVAAAQLAGFKVAADPVSYHCWWELPPPWRADTFVGAAARLGIAVTPAAAFAVSPGQAPAAVRLALASPPLPALDSALQALARLAHGAPGDVLED
jgi:DNA-binding transcriptional MocR family regulator